MYDREHALAEIREAIFVEVGIIVVECRAAIDESETIEVPGNGLDATKLRALKP